MHGLTDLELRALEQGLAAIHRGRLIPIIRGGAPDDPADPVDPPADPVDAPADRTFTQAELDRIVQDRVARAKKDAPADYDDLKAKAARLDEIEEANKTEIQKATDRAAAAERRAIDAETRAQETRLRSSIIAEAAKRGLADPEDAVHLLDRSVLEFEQDGTPSNIADAMDSLLKAKPHLAGGGGPAGGGDQGARTRADGKPQLTSTAGMSPGEIAAAVAEGRLDDYLKSPNRQ